MLAITFTGAPIPFAKVGGFPPKVLQDLIKSIKDAIKNGKDALNALKAEFENRFRDAIDRVETTLEDISKDGYARLREALPGLFEKEGDIAVARNKLLDRIGSIQSYADTNKILGQTIRQWADIGNSSLYDAVQGYKDHTNQISGVQIEDKILTLEKIAGYKTLGIVNVTLGSNVVSPDLYQTSYPTCNVGDTIRIANTDYTVTGKIYNSTDGNVRVNANSIIVYTTNLNTFNLANIAMDSGSGLKMSENMYIKVGNEVRKINTINALGDYMTVYTRFGFTNSDILLSKEFRISINTVAIESGTDIPMKLLDYQHANSLCLDDTITSTSAFFLNYLSPGDKIYYDEKEYYVQSLTNDKIIVDEPLRLLNNQIVSKITNETPVTRISDSNAPEDILDTFDTVDIFTSSFGPGFIDGLTTRYKKADGTYATIEAYKPIHAAQSISPQQRERIINPVTRVIQDMIDELQDDVIRELTDIEIVNLIDQKTQEIEAIRNNLIDVVNQDLAAINAVKGLISGLLKLFKASCSKKKKSDIDKTPDDSSDEYLRLIIKPNPVRQGCLATESDLIEILDLADEEYRNVSIPTVNTAGPALANTNPAIFEEFQDTAFIPGTSQEPGGLADIEIDEDPELIQPPKPKDPCVEPC